VSVVFRKGGKAYYFDPDGLELSSGDCVIVKTARGTEFGEVVAPAQEMPEELIPGQLKKVIRKANDADREQVAQNKAREEEAFKVAQEKVGKRGLSMKLVDVEAIFDGSKMLFYFTSEERIDFRDLVRDLASAFKTRIEMRQIGVRDEAKMVGGLGPCGRRLCCTVFAGEFEPVSIRMAKEQNLPLNPMKISGICGRLMCCLRYEYEVYKDFRGRAPKKGTIVETPLGEGKIVDYNVPKDQVTIVLEGGMTKQVSLCDVCSGGGSDSGRRSGAPRGAAKVAAEQGPNTEQEGAKAAQKPSRETSTESGGKEPGSSGDGGQPGDGRPPKRRRRSRGRGKKPGQQKPETPAGDG
jgi:cell fate regulator YaaT (PSP1 superfamily)